MGQFQNGKRLRIMGKNCLAQYDLRIETIFPQFLSKDGGIILGSIGTREKSDIIILVPGDRVSQVGFWFKIGFQGVQFMFGIKYPDLNSVCMVWRPSSGETPSSAAISV